MQGLWSKAENKATFQKGKHQTFDDTTTQILTQLHLKPRSNLSLSDEWETPDALIQELCCKYNIQPELDVCSTHHNSKCRFYFTKEMNSLEQDWLVLEEGKHSELEGADVWCNPPHSLTGKFVEKAHEQWKEHNISIMMILPANTMSSIYWHEYIEGNAEYHAIKGRIRFKIDGVASKFMSRNAYVCVIFRKRE